MIPEGAYLDGFFTIQLKTDKTNEDLLSINSNPEMLQTVVHEYVHFLQDIFLLFGMVRAKNKHDLIASLYCLDKDSVSLPIDLDSEFGSDCPSVIDRRIIDVCENAVSEKDSGKRVARSEYNQIKIENKSITITGYEIPQHFLLLIDSERKQFCRFPFGANCIYECMASLLERHLFPDERKSYWIPYDLPLIYLEHVAPKLSSSKAAFLVCCVSLLWKNPSEMFFRVVEACNCKNDSSFSTLESILDIVNSTYGMNLGSELPEVRTKLEMSISNIFNTDNPEWLEARDWILEWLRESNDFCLVFDEIARLFDVDSLTARSAFINLMNNRVSPPIVNSRGIPYCIGASTTQNGAGMISIWVIMSIFFSYVFENEETGCPFSDICVEQNTMTDACFEKPLSSRIRKKPFCLLTQMYRQWGLYKHKTKKGDDYLEKISKFQ